MGPAADDEDSPAASSENDNDEMMEDAEGADMNGEADGEADDADENDDNDDDEDQDDTQDAAEGPQGHTNQLSSPSQRHLGTHGSTQRPRNIHHGVGQGDSESRRTGTPETDAARMSSPSTMTAQTSLRKLCVREEALKALVYDIAPTIAAPHSTSINAVTATPDMRWVFSAGADGWIRKFDWIDTLNAKTMLTVAQRHPFVDSVTKAGVLASYWENEEPSDRILNPSEQLPLSAAYSLAVQRQALWLLSGTEVGAINLQAVRHDEGRRITSLQKHTSAVSVMSLSQDETSLLSGSWDKTILDWDLNSGQVKRSFLGSGSQISAIEVRPLSLTPVPSDTLVAKVSETFRSSDASEGRKGVTNDEPRDLGTRRVSQDNVGSPADSLFDDHGDQTSLFGDNDNSGPGTLGFNEDEENEFSRAIASSIQQEEQMGLANTIEPGHEIPIADGKSSHDQQVSESRFQPDGDPSPRANGAIPHADVAEVSKQSEDAPETGEAEMVSESTFLDAAIDGTLRVWDRRQPNPVARISPHNVPPWCMHAAWSPDGNFIYAGRRNGTVDEYSIHKGLREPIRSLKFPGGSGPVSAVRAMPNSKHIICASYDILRLYDLHDLESAKHSRVPFLIVPGHRTGVVSHLFIDPTCSFMISTGGNRGWEGSSTEVLLGYEIGIVNS